MERFSRVIVGGVRVGAQTEFGVHGGQLLAPTTVQWIEPMNGKKTGIPDGRMTSGRTADGSSHEAIDDTNDEPMLDPKAQELIGRQLKVLYGSILEEPVPDQFVKLLEDLERKERGA